MDVNEQIENLEKQLLKLRKKYYIKSFFRKAKRLVTDFLPLDSIPFQNYKEKFVVEEANTIEIFLPKTFDQPQASIEKTINSVEVFALQDVYCIPDSTYFLNLKKDKIYYEKWHDDSRIHYLYNTKNLIQHGVTLAKVQNHKIKHFDTEAIFLGGIFTFNYYHFFIEILSKTEFFKTIPDYKNKIIVVDSCVDNNQNMKDLLSFFTKDCKIVFLNSASYYHFKTLWHITSPSYTIPNVATGSRYEAGFSRFSKKSLAYLRQKCFENFDYQQVKIEVVKKIFISRKSQFRKYNEQEILGVSQKYGFTEVFFEDLNIHEQIFIINNADYIIGPSGAAWTNLLFAKDGAKGLAWLSSVWGDFSVFSTIAKMVNFDLNFFIYPQITDDFHEDFILDSEIFEKQLEKLLQL